MIDVKVAVFLFLNATLPLTSTLANEYPSNNETSKKNGTVRGDCIACDALFRNNFSCSQSQTLKKSHKILYIPSPKFKHCDRQTLYHVTIKPCLYQKAVQVYDMLNYLKTCDILTHPKWTSSPKFQSNELHIETGSRNYFTGVKLNFMLGALSQTLKISHKIFYVPSPDSNLCFLGDSRTLHHITIKAGLYRKAIQVYT